MGNSVIMCVVECYKQAGIMCGYLSLTISQCINVGTKEVQQHDGQDVMQWKL